MFNFFKSKSKPRTLLDSCQEVSNRLIIKGYRRIASQHGCAPTAKTSDAKIVEIYNIVGTAFQEVAERRGEHIPAPYISFIIFKFLQAYEMFIAKNENFFHEHLKYEIDKFASEGLRPEYRQELALFDFNGNDPDVKLLHRLMEKAVLETGKETKVERSLREANSGDAVAQFTIGGFYERGQFGFEQNFQLAAGWYQKAAEQGHAGAQLYLGVFLAQGQGLEQNVVEAYKWIDLAKKGNMMDKVAATECLQKLMPVMTSQQITDGQRLSNEFVPKCRVVKS